MPIEKSALERARLRPAELLVGLPLQVLEEADAIGIGAGKFLDFRRVRTSIRLRPLLPRRAGELLGERLEERVAAQQFTLFAAEALERLDPSTAGRHGVVFAEKAGIKRFQNRQLDRLDPAIGDLPQLAADGKFGVCGISGGARLGALGVFRDRFDIDIERIEKQPRAGRVGARLLGAGKEQRVQGVEPDHGGSDIGGDVDQFAKVGEVADPPVLGAVECVELSGDPPGHVAGRERRRKVTLARGDDEPHRLGRPVRQSNDVVSHGQCVRQSHDVAQDLAPVRPPAILDRRLRRPKDELALGARLVTDL